ncbi:hypothetical protein K490DRAFT_64364 [Saccharata proteae CBS 121410]|uniref:Uncharacterized protein n=1 Tax=Saccharata proteae CBS 121410 TaxID=1314787 RepID=A0A6A5YCT2_9PEZI|nr:hypothetical protein K490DRAFT_64364 [Saccharata proteae CBS 121410]
MPPKAPDPQTPKKPTHPQVVINPPPTPPSTVKTGRVTKPRPGRTIKSGGQRPPGRIVRPPPPAPPKPIERAPRRVHKPRYTAPPKDTGDGRPRTTLEKFTDWVGSEDYKKKVIHRESKGKRKEIEKERVSPWGETWYAEHPNSWEHGETRFTRTVASNNIEAMLARNSQTGVHAKRPDPSEISRAPMFPLPNWKDDADTAAVIKKIQDKKFGEQWLNTTMSKTLKDRFPNPVWDVEEKDLPTGHFGVEKQAWLEEVGMALSRAYKKKDEQGTAAMVKVSIDSQGRNEDELRAELLASMRTLNYRQSEKGRADLVAKKQNKEVQLEKARRAGKLDEQK